MLETQRKRLSVGRVDPNSLGVGSASGAASTLASKLKDREFPGGGKVTCVHTVTDEYGQKKKSFAEKDRAGCKDGEALSEAALKNEVFDGVVCACRKGLKPESPNQDSFAVVQLPTKWTLYGVFDGHGPNGHDVSGFAVTALIESFLNIEDFATNPVPAFQNAFIQCQEQIKETMAKGASSSGTTCTMAFQNLETDKLTIAHVADSRSVLYKGLVPGTAVHETRDHKPDLPDEKKRIESNGGRVVFDGYYNHRVFAKAGMYPGLNMSRALGDLVGNSEAGVSAEPEIAEIDLRETRGGEALTLLLCSDGVWEFIPSADALTRMGIAKGTAIASENLSNGVANLAKASWDAWMQDSDHEISDDITAIAVML